MIRWIFISVFLISFALFAVVEWRARREDSTIPTLGDLTGFVMQHEVGPMPIGRIALFGFWWWVGWHFFAR